MNWDMPPITKKKDGTLRHVGFELEFTGVDLTSIGDKLSTEYGGKLESESLFQHKVKDTEFGDFILEVDSIQLKERKYIKLLENIGIKLDEEETHKIDEKLYDFSKIAVPFELVTPPIPIDRISELSKLGETLFKMSTKGTRASVLYGFGMQFNPEISSLDSHCILNYLRAFFLLLDWLKAEIDVDITRRIMPFINDFPQQYILKVLQPDYDPTMEQLIDDYLEYNPTRNRPLDMTCMFAHIDKERTFSKVDDYTLIKPRPTFHYRLPDCRIDEHEWSMALEWNRWVKVERLANNHEAIKELSKKYLNRHKTFKQWLSSFEDWFEHEKS